MRVYEYRVSAFGRMRQRKAEKARQEKRNNLRRHRLYY